MNRPLPGLALFLITLVLFSALAEAREDPPLDPRVELIRLRPEDFPGPVVLDGTGLYPNFVGPDRRLVGTLTEYWYADWHEIRVTYGVFETRQEAAQAFAIYTTRHAIFQRQDVNPPFGETPLSLGDVTLGNRPASVFFIKDRAFCGVTVLFTTPSSMSLEEILALPKDDRPRAEDLARIVAAKMEAIGMGQGEGFEMRTEVLSPVVDLRNGTPLRVLLTFDTSLDYGPFGTGFDVLSREHKLYDVVGHSRQIDELTYLFEWDGKDKSGQPVPPGRYHLDINTSDLLWRLDEATIDFDVVDGPSELSLLAARDSFLRYREPHLNEGGNRQLALMKITGKPARPVVGFDLSNLATAGLTRATLVLSVDPADSPTGWGKGRAISVRRLLEPWVEGNGRNFGFKKSQQASGSGSGATWFSPADTDISNDDPDGAGQWAGGDWAADAPTAPPMTMTNHFTGEMHFNVTQDVLNGAENGWVVVRDDENVGSKVSFYSREGAVAAGSPELAPRLVLEFGGTAVLQVKAVALERMTPRVLELGFLSRSLASMVREQAVGLVARQLWLEPLTCRLLYRLATSPPSIV